MKEWLYCYSGDGTLLGVAPRSEVHAKGLLHSVVHTWIVTTYPFRHAHFFHDAAVWPRTGRLLLQRRSLKKDSYPGMLDISSAGHMSADGADQLHAPVPLEHAKRELREELGLCFEDARFELIGTYLFHAITNGGTFIDNEITHMFLITVDESEVAKDKLKLQEDEVGDVVLMPFRDVRSLILSHTGEITPFDSFCKEAFDQFFELLEQRFPQ